MKRYLLLITIIITFGCKSRYNTITNGSQNPTQRFNDFCLNEVCSKIQISEELVIWRFVPEKLECVCMYKHTRHIPIQFKVKF